MAALTHLRRLVLRVFSVALKLARAMGITRPLRRVFSPFAGKMISRLSSSGNGISNVHGHKMVLASPGRYPPVAMAIDEYEQETTSLFERILKSGMVMMDVGAHVGYFSLLAARHVGPGGKVFAFEPDPVNYGLLLQNIELNSYTNVSAVNAAVADRVGLRTLFQTALDSGRHSTYHHGLPESGSVEVETWTLDAFLEARDWPTVDLIKVDVEGAEVDVLQGMAGLLEKTPDLKMIIEFNPSLLESAGVDPLEFPKQLATWNFNISRIDEKRGVLPLGNPEIHDFVTGMLRDGSSVNLYCAKI